MTPAQILFIAVPLLVLSAVVVGVLLFWNRLLQKSLNAARERTAEQAERMQQLAKERFAEDKVTRLRIAELEAHLQAARDSIIGKISKLEPRDYKLVHTIKPDDGVTDREQMLPIVNGMVTQMAQQILDDVTHDLEFKMYERPDFFDRQVTLSCKVSPEAIEGAVRGFDAMAILQTLMGGHGHGLTNLG